MKVDLIGIVDAIYKEANDDGAWLRHLGSAAKSLDLGLGMMGYTFVADPRTGPKVLETTSHGTHGCRLLETAYNMVTEQGVNALDGFSSQVSLLSVIASPVADDGFVQRHLRRVGRVGNAVDILGVVGADSSGQGVVLSALVPPGWQLTRSFRQRWGCITSHLASGRRLRTQPEPAPDEAVLDLSGKLHHAVGKATSRSAGVALRQAARAIDRARARQSGTPDVALASWNALVSGRWSLVDRFESDGRTFLIAKPNLPRPPVVPRFTPRERAVVALAALGRSNKLIAYELGISLGSVGNYLLRAQHRIGAGSRAALIRAFLSAVREASEARSEDFAEDEAAHV